MQTAVEGSILNANATAEAVYQTTVNIIQKNFELMLGKILYQGLKTETCLRNVIENKLHFVVAMLFYQIAVITYLLLVTISSYLLEMIPKTTKIRLMF